MLVRINILNNREMDFLYSGVTDYAGYIIAYFEGEGEAVRSSLSSSFFSSRAVLMPPALLLLPSGLPRPFPYLPRCPDLY
jgi:hypothetical protein